MITIKRCSEVPMKDIYKAFALGFSDYIIPLTLSQDEFEARFFGPEGNKQKLSYVAYNDNEPVGLVLGGVRIFDHIKTMRCGTLCVAPDYRGVKVSQQLMTRHIAAAKVEGCKQLFLEVIKNNHRAVKFYERLGYQPVYSLKYYSIQTELLEKYAETSYLLTEVDFEKIENYRKRQKDVHINWQNELDCFQQSSKHIYLLARDNEVEIGYIAMSPSGKIEQLYVEPAYRNQGVGTSLIASAAKKQKVEKVNVCLPSNSSYEGFLINLHFTKGQIEQFEMYLPINLALE